MADHDLPLLESACTAPAQQWRIMKIPVLKNLMSQICISFILAHYDRCEGRSSRQKKETQSVLKFTKSKKRSLPEETEAASSSKKSKSKGDSDIDSSDRETG